MKVQCPNCRHDFEVTVAVVEKRPDIQSQYRLSVARLQRAEQLTRTIAPMIVDPDRPVSR